MESFYAVTCILNLIYYLHMHLVLSETNSMEFIKFIIV